MSAYTTTDLIQAVRVRGMFPDASKGTLSPDNILLIASEELRSNIAPMILGVREKYYETFVEYPLTANQAIYAIPSRATGSMVSLVQYIINNSVQNLNPIDPNGIATTVTGLYPRGFYFENDHIVIYPTPNSTTGTIRLRYYQRPSLLTQVSNCTQITAVDQPNGTVTVQTVPSTWSGGILVDFVGNKSPYSPYGVDSAIQNVTANLNDYTISFNALPTNRDGMLQVAVGDWLCPAEYTCLPEFMAEYFTILVQRTVVKLLVSIGDRDGAVIAREELNELLKNGVNMITPRDAFGLKKVKSDWRNW